MNEIRSLFPSIRPNFRPSLNTESPRSSSRQSNRFKNRPHQVQRDFVYRRDVFVLTNPETSSTLTGQRKAKAFTDGKSQTILFLQSCKFLHVM